MAFIIKVVYLYIKQQLCMKACLIDLESKYMCLKYTSTFLYH